MSGGPFSRDDLGEIYRQSGRVWVIRQLGVDHFP